MVELGVKETIIKMLGGKVATDEAAADESIARWRSSGGSSYGSSRTFVGDVDDEKRLFLSQYEPVVYWVVTRIANDIFDDGFTVINIDDEDDVTFNDAVQEAFDELDAIEKLKLLTRFERRYGTSLLLCRYSAESIDTWDTPMGEAVRPELEEIVPFPWTKVTVDKHDEELTSPTYGYPTKYKIGLGIGNIRSFVVDASRTIRMATRLDEHLYLGVSIVDLMADDAIGYRTFVAALYKSMVRYGTGAPELNFPEATFDQLETWRDQGHFNDISNRTFYLSGRQGGELTFKGLAGTALDPTPLDNIALSRLSMVSGVPKDILRGTQAGTLSGSKVDERQYFKRIGAEQAAVEPTVRALIDILISTGQLVFEGEYKIRWNSTPEIDAKEQAEIDFKEAQASMMELKWKTINEVREANKMDPIEGGDVIIGLRPEPEEEEEPEEEPEGGDE